MGNWKEIKLSREPSHSTLRECEEIATSEESVQLVDLTTKSSIVALAAEDDAQYDYYLLKVTSSCVIS